MDCFDWQKVEEEFIRLPVREQMLFIERLMRLMRQTAYLDLSPEELSASIEEMARDPAVQHELESWSTTPPGPVSRESA